MAIVTIHAAKTNLSQLLARAEAGEEIILARGKQPIAKLVPLTPNPTVKRYGVLRGKINLGPDFFEPLPDEELDAWDQ